MIWFGSLEFMSLGYGYDMVLLPPRHPTDGNHELSQPRERCAGTIALARHVPPGDGVPSATAVIAPQRVMVSPGLAPLSQMPTCISSLRICVG
jgi:hypothetical protein